MIWESKKAKKYIRSRFLLHDRYQLETIFDYSILKNSEKLFQGASSYIVDSYFYIPNEIGFRKQTIPTREALYNEMRPLIRLREPRMSFAEMISESFNTDSESPLLRLQSNMKTLVNNFDQKIHDETIAQIKLFSCIYTGYLLKSTRKFKKIAKKIGRNASKDELNELMQAALLFLNEGQQLLQKIRGIRKKNELLNAHTMRFLRQQLQLVEEYCSYVFRDCTTWIKIALDNAQIIQTRSDISDLRKNLADVMKKERNYYKSQEFSWIDKYSTEYEKEQYLRRRRFLKKHLWSVLYLDVRKNPSLQFRRQFGAAVAAALATALWVVLQIGIAIKSDLDLTRFDFFNLSTIYGLIAFVFAYAIKDRIKDLGKSRFSRGIFRNIPDNYEHIEYTDLSGKTHRFGTVLEYNSNISFQMLPKKFQVNMLKKTGYSLEYLKKNSQFVHYRKIIKLRRNRLDHVALQFDKIHDVTRINLQIFLARLDDSIQHHSIINDDAIVEKVDLPKTYFIDLMTKYQLARSGKVQELKNQYLRIILNREGLLRLEEQ
ncbi:MAG: hypothetical protein KBD78_03010 [Oligoflexales bacterium]|nr:hypothetical protein [Oligoflexales bacterium]